MQGVALSHLVRTSRTLYATPLLARLLAGTNTRKNHAAFGLDFFFGTFS
jgi:hypothetical protein